MQPLTEEEFAILSKTKKTERETVPMYTIPTEDKWKHFDEAYKKAHNSSRSEDWFQAALLAQQVRNEYRTYEDPMNVIIVGGVPYSFEDVEEIISGFCDGHHREYFTSERDMHLDCFTNIVHNLKPQSKDTSLEAWRKEVVAGNTTSGYIAWKNEA